MNKNDLGACNVVQIDPQNKTNPMFGGCFLIITEVKDWGVMGYVQSLGEDMKIGGQAYIRLKWEDIEPVGEATWMLDRQYAESEDKP